MPVNGNQAPSPPPDGEHGRVTCPGCGAQLRVFALYRYLHRECRHCETERRAAVVGDLDADRSDDARVLRPRADQGQGVCAG